MNAPKWWLISFHFVWTVALLSICYYFFGMWALIAAISFALAAHNYHIATLIEGRK